MAKFIEYIQEAEKIIRTIDHITYITFPLVKDKKLLLKILLETKIAITNCINSILQCEYIYKRISLYKDPKTNFKTFQRKCAKRYGINEKEIRLILDLFNIIRKHNQSPMEFMRPGKIIILSENSTPKIITIEEVKEFLILGKNILEKTKQGILR
jgi:hypothetical protein